MFRRTNEKALVASLIGVMFLWSFWISPDMVNPQLRTQNLFSPIQKYKVETDFVKFIKSQFAKSVFARELDVSNAVSIVAVPAQKLISIDDIKKGAIVGGVYFSSGSLKYDTPPGSYAVYVKEEGPGCWFAEFKDLAGKGIRKVQARVILGVSVDKVMGTVEYSICYRINGGIVCI